VTFKELQKLMQQYYSQSTGIKQVKLSDRLNDKPFWIWTIEEHKLEDIRSKGDCCFNHILYLPKKNELDKPF
jgi:hypothetical protein